MFEYVEERSDILPATYDELKQALNQLKKNKAPGPDNLTVELLLHGGDTLHKCLLKMINLIFEFRSIPSQLELTEIITLFKKETQKNGILILNTIENFQNEI